VRLQVVAQRALAFQSFLDAIAADSKLRILPVVAAFLGAEARSCDPAARPERDPSFCCCVGRFWEARAAAASHARAR
jgi:hypothetical protein